MSTVLWANVMSSGEVRSDQQDRYALYRHADKLDALAKKLGLPSFLSACDDTDLRFNLEDRDLPEGMSSTTEVMAAKGAWLARAEAQAMLEGLVAHIRTEQTRFGLINNQHRAVVEEMTGVLAFLESQPDAERFNFAIVM